jgi:probable phosphoglycerate mutase
VKEPLLYLIRHGQAAPPQVLAGQKDYPLSPAGERQALALRSFFAAGAAAAKTDIRCWVSPLSRARRTAELALDPPGQTRPCALTEVEDLREISLGVWEGMEKERIQKEFPALWAARGEDPEHIAPPGGESYAQLAARVIPAFLRLCAEAGPPLFAALVVAHRSVNQVILAHCLGLPLTDAPGIPQDYACLNTLTLTGTAPRVLEINRRL